MATIIQIKRSSATSAPLELAQGELAYTYGTGTQGNNGDRLFVGTGTETNGAANIDIIGGKYFTGLLSHVHGTLTASSAIIVDANKAIDELYVGNSTTVGGTIKFNEGTNNGTDYVALKAPNNLTSGNVTLTLPSSAGTAGQFLQVDGSGNLSFQTVVSNFTIAADVGTSDSFNTGETLTISGDNGIQTTVTDNEVTIAGIDATTSTKGVASFSSTNFSVTSGAVSIANDGVDTLQIKDAAVTNAKLQYSKTTLGNTDLTLGSTTTTLAGLTQLDVDNIRIDGNTISSTDVSGNIIISPDDAGDILLNADTVRFGDLNTNANITTNGTGNLVLSTNSGTNSGTITIHQGVDGNINLEPNGEGVVKVPAGYLLRSQIDDNTLVTKSYVDALQQGLHVHEAVAVATTDTLAAITGGSVTYANGTLGVGATLTLSNALTILDGYTLQPLDRILVKDQANTAHNGIYVYTNSTLLTRATDFDTIIEVASGDFLFVSNGTQFGSQGFVQTQTTTAIGTSPILFTQFSGTGQIIAGDGLSKLGNELSVNVDDTTIEINNDELRVKDAGITAAKLATDSVETDKIVDGDVTNAKLENSKFTIIGSDASTDDISLGDTLTIANGEAITSSISANTLTLTSRIATSSLTGVAYFPTANFTVTSGSVAITHIDGGTF